MQALADSRSLFSAPPDPLADEIQAVLEGDRAAARRLCIELGPVVVKTLRRLLGSSHPDLDDLLQETLLGVLDGLARFRGGSSLRHFARRVATLRALETIRNSRTQSRKLEELGVDEPRTSAPPSTAFESKRRQVLLHELLRSLPEAQAEALVLQAVLGHSLEETAEILSVPVNTIRGRLQTAKHSLRARIHAQPELLELLESDDHEP